eukprot:2683912-Rhodomonas_salina.2
MLQDDAHATVPLPVPLSQPDVQHTCSEEQPPTSGERSSAEGTVTDCGFLSYDRKGYANTGYRRYGSQRSTIQLEELT